MFSCESLFLQAGTGADIYSGPLIYTPDQTKRLLELADPIKKIVESDEVDGRLSVWCTFLKPPGSPMVQPVVLIFYDGPTDEAKQFVKPLYDLGPVADMTHVIPYAQVNAPNPLAAGPPTHQRYANGNFQSFFPLDVDMWLTIVDDFDAFMAKYGDAVAPSKIGMEIRSYRKSSSVPVSAMAFALRPSAILSVLEAQYDPSVSDTAIRADVKAIVDKARQTIMNKGLYGEGNACFNANISSGKEKVTELFGENLPKLRELKKKYDPNFVFKTWYPIAPAA
jgi:hypothetical protein